MDILSFSYEGNKLITVDDVGNTMFGFKDRGYSSEAGNDYEYDANGNMIDDYNKLANNIEYNHLNLPVNIEMTQSTFAKGFIHNTYDANGLRQSKSISSRGGYYQTFYAGNYVYTSPSSGAEPELSFFHHSEGYVEPENDGSFTYIYQFKDHLGNIRLSYADDNNDGVISASTEIREENNYYPFGMKHQGYNNLITSTNKALDYKFNGIELNEDFELDLYEMPLRQYDPAIGRFTSIDPVTHHSFSTYSAFDNNPVFWADPSGADGTAGTPDNSMGIEGNDIYGRNKYDENGLYISPINRDNIYKNGFLQDPKKYRLLTQGTTQGYIDFIPDKDANGNELSSGKQLVVEKMNVMNKYLIKNSTGKSELLYVLTEYTLQTIISSDGKNISSNIIIQEKSGRSLNTLEEGIPLANSVKLDELPENHVGVVNQVVDKIKSTGKSWASSHRDLGLDITGYGGAAGVVGSWSTLRNAFGGASVGIGARISAQSAIALLLTNLSINATPASSMRLNLYYQNFRQPGSIFKEVKE